jgi:hypothetical protein
MNFDKSDYDNHDGKTVMTKVPRNALVKLLGQELYLSCIKSWAFQEKTKEDFDLMGDGDVIDAYTYQTPYLWQLVAIFSYELVMEALHGYIRAKYAETLKEESQ